MSASIKRRKLAGELSRAKPITRGAMPTVSVAAVEAASPLLPVMP